MSQYTNKTPEGVSLDGPALDPHGGHMWDPPGISEVARGAVPFGTGESNIIGAVGAWANYEVWIDVPNTWLETELILRLKNSELVNELDRNTPAQIEHMTATAGGFAGVVARTGVNPADRIKGLLFSNYGRPGFGQLTVVAQQREVLDGGQRVRQSDGKFYMRMWGTEGTSVGDRVGRPIVDKWASRAQGLNFTTPNMLEVPFLQGLGGFRGGTTFGPLGTPRAVHLTDLTVTTDSAVPILCTLQQSEPVSATMIARLQFFAVAGAPVVLDFANPLTGLRGWNWDILRAASLDTFTATLNGFEA